MERSQARVTNIAARILILATTLMAVSGGAAWAEDGSSLTVGKPEIGFLDTVGRWSFEAEAGQVVRVTAESAAFDTVLEVRSPAGEVLAENDDCGSFSTDSCLEMTFPVAGRYEFRVTAFLGAGTGFYTVAVQQAATATATATPLEMNTATPGRLGEDEQAVGRWSFEAEAGQVVRVTAESAAFDTVLEVRSPAGEVLAENDDCSFDTTDSCLETILLPVTGRYELRVTAYFAGTGTYEVTAHTVGSRPPTDEDSVEPEGTSVVGALQQDDQAYASGEHYDEYTVEVGPGETLVAEVQSEEFETYLVMISPSGNRTSRSGLMQHGLSRVRLEVDAAETGAWEVNVTSVSAAETGAYRLWLDVGSSGPTLVHGTLEAGDAEGRDGEYVDVHPFEARVLDCLAVRLSGPAGLRVRVLGPDGYHAESDTIPVDGGTVVFDDVLLAGQHRVLVTGAVGQTGAYTLEVGVGCLARRGPEATAAQTYGIFVGVSDYGGRANDLPRTADDARRLAGTLVNAGVLPAGNAIVLTDEEATVAGLERAVSELGPRIGPADTFLFFYSGHGDRVQRAAPEPADPDGYDETIELFDGTLRDNEVNALLGQIEADLTLVALDTCFAGGFAKDLISIPGRMGLFSSEEDVTSGVPDNAGGYLSGFLIDAVAGGRADTDGDAAIRAIELRQYLHERYRTDVKGPHTGIVSGRGPAYQHLQVDPGSVRPTDVIFRLQPLPVSVAAAQAPTFDEDHR